MAQNVWGADADALDDLARRLGEAARTMDAIAVRLSSQVVHAPWHGAGADRFRSDWSRSYRRQLSSAVSFLREGESALHRNATQQRTASSARQATGGLRRGGLAIGIAARYVEALGMGWRSQLGPHPTPAQVADLVRRASQAVQWLEHPSLTLDGQREWGVSRQMSVDGRTTVGGFDVQGQADAMYRAGAEVHGSATLTASELTLTAGGSAGVMATAYAAGTVSRGMMSARGRVGATAGERVYAGGTATLNQDGLTANAEAGAIIGASVSATGEVDAGGVGVGGGVSGYVGIGIEAEAEAEVTMDHVEATVKLGAALGIGGSVEVHVDVQPAKIVDGLQDGANQIKGFLNHVL